MVLEYIQDNPGCEKILKMRFNQVKKCSKNKNKKFNSDKDDIC